MNDNFLGLKTDPSLLNKLQRAAGHKPSQAQIVEQRVSYVYGSVKPSSGVTREQVRNVISGNATIILGSDK
jgi:hypothetical protein